MSGYKIVLLPGDGIGPEVMGQARKVLTVIGDLYDIDFDLIERPCGFEHMHQTGQPWQEGTLELCRDDADAVLLGAIGRADSTQPLGIGEKSPGRTIVLGLRAKLDLYANVRPVMLFPNVMHTISGVPRQVWRPENVNLVIVRENTEGFYIDSTSPEPGHKPDPDEVIDQRLITKKGSERVIRFAFSLARGRSGAPVDGKKRVTCVDKSNVLNGCRLFRAVFNSVAGQFPDIEPDHKFIDAFTLALLQNPENSDVVVTTNLFGDIMTDLAAVLQGGLGMAPSANIGDDHALFEPVHGSAPGIAGKNMANPIGMILSVQMMLGWLGERKNDEIITQTAEDLALAIRSYFETGSSLPVDIGGKANTPAVAEKIIEQLKIMKK